MGDIGGPELILIIVVLVLLFGARKLPDMARGAGQALRVFKEETRELREGDRPAPARTEDPDRTDAA